MIDRYSDGRITKIWEDKLKRWEDSELAVLQARVNRGELKKKDYDLIFRSLKNNPINIEWWLKKDEEIHHDLNAFLEERLRYIPKDLRVYFHKGMTSYDTEEPAFVTMLKKSVCVVENDFNEVQKIIKEMAIRYRWTIMVARTHGQEAEIQSFGKRCLCWLQDLSVSFDNLQKAKLNLNYSKMSGAIGNYGSLDPEIEEEALKVLGFEPYIGSTQIMPREMYAPLAQALSQIVSTLNKVALTIRLGSRSGPNKIYQEPFTKKQKGSSIMPHKKNPWRLEGIEGKDRIAKAFARAIIDNISTWEERTIEQSGVERIAWPDLFHITVRVLKDMKRVLGNLVVLSNNMLREIINLRGCYATGQAASFLKEKGFPIEDAYRTIQLAAFNAFQDKEVAIQKSFELADNLVYGSKEMFCQEVVSIQVIIPQGILRTSNELEANKEKVEEWNSRLKELFEDQGVLSSWNQIFKPSYLLRNEEYLYRKILGL